MSLPNFVQEWFDYLLNDVLQPALMPLVYRGLVPDSLLRFGMRKLLESTLHEQEHHGDAAVQQNQLNAFIEDIRQRPIAENTKKANEQHYEVPPELYRIMLGPWLKYSACYWPRGVSTLAQAEEAMLALVCDRAEIIGDGGGLNVLDLGCGWGSCGLYIASRFPKANVTMVSNSISQREFILEKARSQNLNNVVAVKTMDANTMTFGENQFDRIVSNEMFEHMKNYEKLLAKVASWLKPGGKLFVHIFTHKSFAYHFESGWMAETFFTGGTMPSKDLLLRFQRDLVIDDQWVINGMHYSRTLEEWLKRLDKNKRALMPFFEGAYGQGKGKEWHSNWRLFNMACSELFAYNSGNEWFVSHYRFVKR